MKSKTATRKSPADSRARGKAYRTILESPVEPTSFDREAMLRVIRKLFRYRKELGDDRAMPDLSSDVFDRETD